MLHATYFVVGHFHLVMAVAALFGIFAGTYFWFPKVTGKDDERDLGEEFTSGSLSSARIASLCRFTIWEWQETSAAIRRSSMTLWGP